MNKGLIEPAALTLLGASTKRGNDSLIGQFGSGNKYALAFLLRSGYDVKIFAGAGEIRLGIVTKTFREQSFDILTVDGQETSITLDLGYKWTLWDALRELYSNALDEGLIGFGIAENNLDVITNFLEGSPERVAYESGNFTSIEISVNPNIEDFFFNIRDYIATGNEVVFECPEGKIYRKHGPNACIYYRGIRCYETSKESIFDYDFNRIDLAENRQIKYAWSLPEKMWQLLFKCEDTVVIRTLLNSIQNTKYLENAIDGDFVSIPELQNKLAWSSCIENNSIVPRDLGGYVKDEDRAATLFLPAKLYTALVSTIGDKVKNKSFKMTDNGMLYHTYRPSEEENAVLDKAFHFFTTANYSAPINHQIITVQFDDKSILGSITQDGEILIADKAIESGVQTVIATIIEEHIHITSQAGDKTRAFQNAAINEFINYMKSVTNIVL